MGVELVTLELLSHLSMNVTLVLFETCMIYSKKTNRSVLLGLRLWWNTKVVRLDPENLTTETTLVVGIIDKKIITGDLTKLTLIIIIVHITLVCMVVLPVVLVDISITLLGNNLISMLFYK